MIPFIMGWLFGKKYGRKIDPELWAKNDELTKKMNEIYK